MDTLSPDERSNSCPPATPFRSQSPGTSSAKSEPMIFEAHREVVVGVCAMNRKVCACDRCCVPNGDEAVLRYVLIRTCKYSTVGHVMDIIA